MVTQITADKRNWNRYTDAIRDYNPIHSSDEAAKELGQRTGLGLEGVVAPGMWIAGHIQAGSKIGKVKQIKWMEQVYEGDVLDLIEQEKVGEGRDVQIKRGDDVVCKIERISKDYDPGEPRQLKEISHSFEVDVSNARVNLFLESLGSPEQPIYPEMFLASLSAPALLSFGKEQNKIGLHTTQSFTMHQKYHEGNVRVSIGDKRQKGPIEFYELRWTQGGVIIASGRAGVLPISTATE